METSGLICKDIQLIQIAAGTITENGTIVAARNCEIDGLTLDGDISPGTGYVGASKGALYMVDDVKLRNFIYCPKYDIRISAEVVWMNSKCIIDGGIIHRMGTTYTGSFFRVDTDQTDCIIQNLTCPEILSWQNAAPIIVGWSNCHRLVMHNNSFTFSGAGPHNTAILINIPAGQTCRITNNSVFITKNATASQLAISMGGVNCLADGNVFDYNAGGGTPSITNSGVGAVTGDNVLAA